MVGLRGVGPPRGLRGEPPDGDLAPVARAAPHDAQRVLRVVLARLESVRVPLVDDLRHLASRLQLLLLLLMVLVLLQVMMVVRAHERRRRR